MNIHEYQGKEILRRYGVATPRDVPCFSVAEADAAAQELGGKVWVVKAQIHAGGHISYDMTLLAGDVIACGTSLGIGSIRDGGAVEVEINGIGSLRNVLAANAAPTSGAGVSPQ